MRLLTTAMMIEARPLVDRLALKAAGNTPFPLFGNDRLVLVVTGTGNLKAATATGWALGRYPAIRSAVNLGFCGAAPAVSAIHQWHFVAAIRDKSTGRLMIPDILWQHPFPESVLLTCPHVVKEDTGWEGLVDMEGSGFYEAARRMLPPDRIALLKWVSDPLTGRIDAESTAMAYARDLDPVCQFIENWPGAIETDLQDGDDLAGQIITRLRLTDTQGHYIRSWVAGYLQRGGDRSRILAFLPETPPATKQANNAVFASLKDVFKS